VEAKQHTAPFSVECAIVDQWLNFGVTASLDVCELPVEAADAKSCLAEGGASSVFGFSLLENAPS
jgi:hypothetical protein